MDETRERFLTAITARLGAERIVELHLFSPLRQGVMETGVAVIAALPDLAGPDDGEEAEAQDDGVVDAEVVGVGDESVLAALESEVDAGAESGDEAALIDDESDEANEADADAEAQAIADAATAAEGETAPEPSPYLDNEPAEPVDVVAVETPAEARHVVFTASYRLTRKGPDRGKWVFEMSATADAPLATVDTVVRGVLHRSKDLTETERLSGEQLRALLAEPAWRTAQ